MPLDESTRRFAFLLQRDLRRFEEREHARAERGEEVRYDAVSRVATWETRRGDVVGRWYGEPLATYNARDRILRWAWAFRSTSDAARHAELVFREGQSRGVPQLAMSVVNDVDGEEAMTLARLGAVAARADGIHMQRLDEDNVELIGLFESSRPGDRLRSDNRISVPPPAVTPRAPTPVPRAGYRSLPPIREIYEPRRSSKPPGVDRDEPAEPPPQSKPSRSSILPLANLAVATMSQKCPGFSQGLLVVTVDVDVPKRHLVVQLVALDADGLLRALDPPRDLVEAAATMIGDAPWRKVTARITPKPDGGATLHVDVL